MAGSIVLPIGADRASSQLIKLDQHSAGASIRESRITDTGEVPRWESAGSGPKKFPNKRANVFVFSLREGSFFPASPKITLKSLLLRFRDKLINTTAEDNKSMSYAWVRI